MSTRRSKLSAFLAAIALIAASSPTWAMGSGGLRCAQPQGVAGTSGGGSQSPLERARRACPLLGAIIEELALQDLGEAFPSESINSYSPEIAVVAAFAASGDTAAMTRHARYALAVGATKLEFKELLYLTAVYAGVPKAIEATRALSDLLTEREDSCLNQSADVDLRHF
jgi:4-carboxymuconolactone decarboxylase